MAQPKVRARYKVVGPKMVKVFENFSRMDKETKSLIQEPRVVEKKTWMVYFPQGHSIRVDEVELRRHGFHLKPRLVDMNTGDVLDTGGDEYDLAEDIPDRDIELVEDDDLLGNNPADQKLAKVK